MAEAAPTPTGVAAGRVDRGPTPGPEHERLNAIIGRWINEGHTINPDGTPGVRILASDVYVWVPGGFFVVRSHWRHRGRRGRDHRLRPRAPEMPGPFLRQPGQYQPARFDHPGPYLDLAGEHTRCTGVFSEDGKTLTAHHERTDDGVNWVPSMGVTLRKVE